ncbi:MAG: PaaI family thioesterase [Stenotrophobium sp.]
MDLRLNAQDVQQLIRANLPAAAANGLVIEAVAPGMARIRFPFQKWMLRPGRVISGPTIFTAADTAMYALVLSHTGPELMAVTATMTLNFLRKGQPGDVIAEARLLKLGRRLVVMEVLIRTGDAPEIIAQVTGSYALPG